MEILREFTYHGDSVIAGGGCEAIVTARTRCWWAKLRECGELLYGRRFPLRVKGAVYNQSMFFSVYNYKFQISTVMQGHQYCMDVKHGA